MPNGNIHEAQASAGGYQAPAVQKAFTILKYIARSHMKLSISELSTALGFSKSTTHGIVHALLREGALAQNAEGKKLFLGPTIVDLAFSGWNYMKITRKAQPLLENLRDTIGETVFLGTFSISSARAVIMSTAEAAKPLKISSPPGTSISLLAGAVGKVFLAGMDPAQACGLIRDSGLPRFTDKSITEEAAYLKALREVRRSGYAIDREEYLNGVKAVAVGLGNIQGLPLALWVVGFASEMTEPVIGHITRSTLKTAAQIQTLLDDDAESTDSGAPA